MDDKKGIQAFKQCVSRRLRGKKRVESQLSFRFPEADHQPRRFWQRRYYDFNVYSGSKLREKLEYMHANPVKERLVGDVRDWPWSSWSFYAGREALLAIDLWS